jgi:tripartite-type tricarboxylate transporter receptor subunit TctC
MNRGDLLRAGYCAAVSGFMGAAVGVHGLARAQERYPTKPVRVIVSFPAGGPTDIVGRVIAGKLTELLGQQFVVENRTGGGGNIGADVVAKAPPDGYTLLVATVSTHAINPGLYKKMPYDPVKDFAPIAQIGVTPTILSVHPSIPVKDLKGLIALAKAKPGKLTYGSAGLGSILHLCGEQFKAAAGGLNILHIPYRGSAPMNADLIAGHIGMVFDGTPTALPLVQTGKIRAIAAGMATRARIARPADLAGAGHRRLRVLHLERDLRSSEDTSFDRPPVERLDQQGARRSGRFQAAAGGRYRSDTRQQSGEARRVSQGGVGEVGADHQGFRRGARLNQVKEFFSAVQASMNFVC